MTLADLAGQQRLDRRQGFGFGRLRGLPNRPEEGQQICPASYGGTQWPVAAVSQFRDTGGYRFCASRFKR